MKRATWISLALSAVLLTTLSTFSALAAGRYSERDVFDAAQRRGYELGQREGRYDQRDGRRADCRSNHAYKDGMVGYRDEYDHESVYKRGFRVGFEEGYNDGFNGYRGNRRGVHNNGDYGYGYPDDRDYRRGDGRNDDRDYRRGDGRNDSRDNSRYGSRPWWEVLNPNGNGRYPNDRRDDDYDPRDSGRRPRY